MIPHQSMVGISAKALFLRTVRNDCVADDCLWMVQEEQKKQPAKCTQPYPPNTIRQNLNISFTYATLKVTAPGLNGMTD